LKKGKKKKKKRTKKYKEEQEEEESKRKREARSRAVLFDSFRRRLPQSRNANLELGTTSSGHRNR
jgi:hypothetical protein